MRGQIADAQRVVRIRDVNERRAVVEPDQGELLSRIRTGPIPHVFVVAACGRAKGEEIQMRKQVNLAASVAFG